jgi:dienelactone hydrolase
MLRVVGCLGLVLVCSATARADRPAFETVRFPAADGLMIEADLYLAHPKSAPFVVLFHQASWSRGEYREIAPRLVSLGFNAMAVDARSGKAVNGVANRTHQRARAARKPTRYVDALADLRAALRHARGRYARGPLIAWGSSYSSALVLRLAGTEPALADATLAFAPGEYFGKQGKSGTWIRDAAVSIKKPVFITSARAEHKNWKAIFAAIPAPTKRSFVPKSAGNHGSRALWRKFSDSPAYWTAVRAFLSEIKGRGR